MEYNQDDDEGPLPLEQNIEDPYGGAITGRRKSSFGELTSLRLKTGVRYRLINEKE